jgi:hypothetical protein
MTHLTSDELIDAVEDMLASDRQAHLAVCDECQRNVAELSGVLGEAKMVPVPEPSPLFWQHFSQRVNAAIDRDAAHLGAWPHSLRWQVLLPLGAIALIVSAVMISVAKVDVAPYAPDAPYAQYAPDDTWETVADIVGQIDMETASAAAVIEPGLAEQAMLELTADEQRELTRLLNAELTRAKS